MSIIERGSLPAGWYPEDAGQSRLRWWDGEHWTNEVRPLVIDMIPDFVAVPPTLVPVPVFESPAVLTPTFEGPAVAAEPLDHNRLAPAPELPAPAPRAHLELVGPGTPLTRRQLRELVGGPLTTQAEPQRPALYAVDPFPVTS